MAKALALMILAFSLVGCYDPNAQRSAIVREVETAGAGDLSTYDVQSLGLWFANHQELATKVSLECAPVERAAPAGWLRSSEGSVCRAAGIMAQPPPVIADQSRSW